MVKKISYFFHCIYFIQASMNWGDTCEILNQSVMIFILENTFEFIRSMG